MKAVCRELGLPRSIFRTNTGRPWAEVSAWAAAQPANITVVDTVRTWVGMDPDSENDAPTVVAALTPLQRATRERAAALMLSHHLTKAGGSHGVAHAGSLAFVGIADVAIEVYRDMHYERRRVLKSISRIPGGETPAELLIELQQGRYVALGDPGSIGMAALVEDVAQVLKLNPEGLTEKELPETLETRTASESFTDTARPRNPGDSRTRCPGRSRSKRQSLRLEGGVKCFPMPLGRM